MLLACSTDTPPHTHLLRPLLLLLSVQLLPRRSALTVITRCVECGCCSAAPWDSPARCVHHRVSLQIIIFFWGGEEEELGVGGLGVWGGEVRSDSSPARAESGKRNSRHFDQNRVRNISSVLLPHFPLERLLLLHLLVFVFAHAAPFYIYTLCINSPPISTFRASFSPLTSTGSARRIMREKHGTRYPFLINKYKEEKLVEKIIIVLFQRWDPHSSLNLNLH